MFLFATMADDLSSRSLFLTIVEVTSLIVLNVLSLTGNTLVCISVYKNTRLRTTTNIYILALALSDLLSAVFVMPFGTGVLITSKWIFGGAFCQLHAFFSLFVIYISPVTMGLTAINRYMRICRPDQQYQRLFSVKKSRAILAFVWTFVACVTAVPRLASVQLFEFVPGYAQCSIAHTSESGKTIHYSFIVTMFFLTPLMATIISYIKVGKAIRQHNAEVASTIKTREGNATCEGNTSISAHEIKVSKSLFVVVFAFMVCWLPFWVIVILRRFHLVARMPRNVELLCMFLLYFSNTINPFIYAGMNPAFKREFRKILLCEPRRKASVGSGSGEKEVKSKAFKKLSIIFHRDREGRNNNCSLTSSEREVKADAVKKHSSVFCEDHARRKNNCHTASGEREVKADEVKKHSIVFGEDRAGQKNNCYTASGEKEVDADPVKKQSIVVYRDHVGRNNNCHTTSEVIHPVKVIKVYQTGQRQLRTFILKTVAVDNEVSGAWGSTYLV